MIDTDVEQWLRQPVKTNNMINLSIDEETKTVQFKGPVNFEKAQVVMQCVINGFGWARQDAKMDVVGCGPTVEPGAPVPIPGINTFPLAPSAEGAMPVFDHNGNPIFYNHPVTGYPCAGEPVLCAPGTALTVSNGGAGDGINVTTTTADAPNLIYTAVPCSNCRKTELAKNSPLWEGNPRA